MRNVTSRRTDRISLFVALIVFIVGLGALNYYTNRRYLVLRMKAQRAACISNLKYIVKAKEEWAASAHKTAADVPSWDDLVGPGHFFSKQPVCKSDGVYSLNPLNKKPTCSITGHTI